MSTPTETIQNTLRRAGQLRPKVGGFPVLAEVLRQAGVRRNEWTLPIGQSVYVTDTGAVAEPGPAVITTTTDVPPFDRETVIASGPDGNAYIESYPPVEI